MILILELPTNTWENPLIRLEVAGEDETPELWEALSAFRGLKSALPENTKAVT
jgi:hypothetical protein